jgi:hypothetical protein
MTEMAGLWLERASRAIGMVPEYLVGAASRRMTGFCF